MTLAAYHGHEPLTFSDYLDLGTGKTLHAVPGADPYDICPASGRAVPDIPEPWFTAAAADGESSSDEAEASPQDGAEPAAEPGGEPEQS